MGLSFGNLLGGWTGERELRGTLERGAREGWESVRGVSTRGEELPRLPRQRLAKRGRLRAPPAAEEASKKEWQRSKFCER